MNYPTDQNELKMFLMADPDVAMEWLDKLVIPFVRSKFKGFRVGELLKSRCDLEQLIQDIRINWWLKVLPQYDSAKCFDLKVWSCFVAKRWIITFFKSLKSKGQPLNSMLTLCDISETNEDPRLSWLENYVTSEEEDQKEKEICADALDDLIATISPVLSDKEQRIFDALVHIYKYQPWLVQHNCRVPMSNIAKKLKISGKDVDNGLQRIRRKLDYLGLR
jgi:DNA-directed RNA polymerase specialized sigma24 family protein